MIGILGLKGGGIDIMNERDFADADEVGGLKCLS